MKQSKNKVTMSAPDHRKEIIKSQFCSKCEIMGNMIPIWVSNEAGIRIHDLYVMLKIHENKDESQITPYLEGYICGIETMEKVTWDLLSSPTRMYDLRYPERSEILRISKTMKKDLATEKQSKS